jgi:hypothetical protein
VQSPAQRRAGVRAIAALDDRVKPVPKYADVLVTIDANLDLDPLVRLGRCLKGSAQTINLGADIFLADQAGSLWQDEKSELLGRP